MKTLLVAICLGLTPLRAQLVSAPIAIDTVAARQLAQYYDILIGEGRDSIASLIVCAKAHLQRTDSTKIIVIDSVRPSTVRGCGPGAGDSTEVAAIGFIDGPKFQMGTVVGAMAALLAERTDLWFVGEVHALTLVPAPGKPIRAPLIWGAFRVPRP